MTSERTREIRRIVTALRRRTTNLIDPSAPEYRSRFFLSGLNSFVRSELKRSATSRKRRLAKLKELAEIQILWRKAKSLEEKREAFEANEKLKALWSKPCWVCRKARGAQRHHVILLSNGGSNNRSNLVAVCERCHAEIHPWMKL